MKTYLKKRLPILFIALCLSLCCMTSTAQEAGESEPLLVRVFHSPSCKSCLKVINDVIPPIARKYGGKLDWQYYDITTPKNHRLFLELKQKTARDLGIPTIVIGDKVLLGLTEIADSLDSFIETELKERSAPLVLIAEGISILDHFRSFGPLAVIGAGLVDGFNPCAFTVIVFFVSFLTLMGYKRREMLLIGITYIFAVFITYLALGLGFFKALYGLKLFYLVSKWIYLMIGALSLFLGSLAVKDYFYFKKTGKTADMALQLPHAIKNKIHAIVGSYYRRDKGVQRRALLGLVFSSLVVGFMVSLLEAVCTGQLYLPTIVFVLKEGTLRAKALFYLIIYNLMFVLPLIAVLLFAIGGVTSRQFEKYAKRHLGLIKLSMAAVFFALGIVLWVGA